MRLLFRGRKLTENIVNVFIIQRTPTDGNIVNAFIIQRVPTDGKYIKCFYYSACAN